MESSLRSLWPRGSAACALAAGLLAASSASAEDRAYVKPSAVIDTVQDDNVFLTQSSRVADSIFRLSPALDAGYRSPTWQVGWRYTFDAERYLDHPNLSTAFARQTAATTLALVATPRVNIGAEASYFRTRTPQELNVTTSLASERAEAERWEIAPSLTYQMSARNRATVSYGYTRDYASYPRVGGVLSATDNARVTLTRQMTASDGVVLEYQARRFVFDGGRPDFSHVVMTGWERRISSHTDVTLRAGPRMADGRFASEAALSLRQRRHLGDLSVEYARSQSTSIGQAQTVGYQRLALNVAARPGRGFELRVMHGVVKNASPVEGLDALVWAVDVDLTKPIGSWLALSGAFHGTMQYGTVGFVDRRIPHSVIMLRLVAGRQR